MAHLAETETDCRPTDNDSRSKRSMQTEDARDDRRHGEAAVRPGRRMGGSAVKFLVIYTSYHKHRLVLLQPVT